MKELTVEGLKEGKEKAINLALSQIERQFGKGAISPVRSMFRSFRLDRSPLMPPSELVEFRAAA